MNPDEKNYKDTIDFWNDIFQNSEKCFDYTEPFQITEIEECLDWLVDENSSIVDFGCGNGKLLLRCLAEGAERAVGIDISSEAIESAKRFAKDNNGLSQTSLVVGGVKELSKFENDEFDAGILSNVIDNLLPEDSIQLLGEFNRIIKQGGKIFLKMNDYVDPSQLEEWNAKRIQDDFYKEESGLYLWNLEDEKVISLLGEHFEIDKMIDVEFKEHDQTNRLYYLRNR